MNRIKVFIVEDNARHLATLCAKVEEAGYEIAGHSNNSSQALVDVPRVSPDVVLMDINLNSDEEGIQLAGMIRERHQIPVVFTTAMASEEVIRKAVGVAPSGYLVKPIDPAELKASIELAVHRPPEGPSAAPPSQDYLTIRIGQRLQKVAFEDVSHLMVESKNYVTLVDREQSKLVVRGSLKQMLESVLPDGFVRTHHSHGINLDFVEYIDESTQSIRMMTGDWVPIGKMFKKEVYARMNIA